MIDWLRRDTPDPAVDLGGKTLPLAIRRHPTARRMVLRLAPDGSEARVTLPRWGRTGDALAFAQSRADWLDRQLAQLPARMAVRPDHPFAYRGSEIALDWREDAPRRPRLERDRLTIGGARESLSRRLQHWLEQEALRLMRGDLEDFCPAAGTALPDLRLSRAQRRWGSCSSSGTVRVNWRLVQAPDAVRRSVVAHEVAHLLHFDHGPAFHALLAQIYDGEMASADAWLKARGRTLYAMFG